MKTNRLRIIRTAAAAVCLALLALLWLDWGTGTVAADGTAAAVWLRGAARPLVHLQLMPAVLSLAAGTLLLLLALTLLLGRVYCSVLCPLGILQDCVSRAAGLKHGRAARRFRYRRPAAWLRYGVLAATVTAVAAGVGAGVALLDSYSIFGRIVYDGLRPPVQGLNNALALVAGDAFGREPVTVSWLSAALSAAMMAVIGVLAWRGGRTYCNSFCPVGTLLGTVSRAAVYRIRLDAGKCVGCGACSSACKGSCIDIAGRRVEVSRCVVCFDCIDACAHGAIGFSATVGKHGAAPADGGHEDAGAGHTAMSRRRFLASLAAAAVAVPAAEARNRSADAGAAVRGTAPDAEPLPVAPAGSGGAERLHALCTACHLCVSKCPTHVLQPAVTEYGLRGLMQPVMRYDKGYCLYDCTACGEACPTGAILPLTPERKRMTFIGRAVLRRERCVVATDAVACGNCADHCPAEAIRMVRSAADGRSYPEVEPELCIGCGRCEYLCPASSRGAIRVEGYARHR